MERKDVFTRLSSILEGWFHTGPITDDDCERPLISTFKICRTDILRLYILVQQVFGIHIDPARLQGYTFNTLNGIIQIIQETLSLQST